MKIFRTFTKAEADELIPEVSKQIENLKDLQKKVDWLEVQIDLDLMMGLKENEKIAKIQSWKDQREGLFRLIQQGIEEIEEMGCLLKDIHHGVVDFCSVCQNQIVYLSWRYGEKEVQYMYFSNEVYENRRPIVESEKRKD